MDENTILLWNPDVILQRAADRGMQCAEDFIKLLEDPQTAREIIGKDAVVLKGLGEEREIGKKRGARWTNPITQPGYSSC